LTTAIESYGIESKPHSNVKPRSPRIWFVDFWHEESIEALQFENPFYRALDSLFELQLDPSDPEYLLCSIFGHRHYRYNCTKVVFAVENVFPDFLNCDYAFSFDPTEGRNFRLPLWSIWMGDPKALLHPVNSSSKQLKSKERFCAFVYSNPRCEHRNKFFRVLTSKKHVDSAGRLFNNTGGLSDRFDVSAFSDLPVFYSRYKFTIAFENFSSPGYTTEKIAAPLLGGSVPIYWGNPNIAAEFNPEAFINAHDFDSLEGLADYVLKIDADDALYQQYLMAPRFKGNKLPEDGDWCVLANRFKSIFSDKGEPVSKRSFFSRHVVPMLPPYALRKMRRRRQRKLGRPGMRNPTIDLRYND